MCSCYHSQLYNVFIISRINLVSVSYHCSDLFPPALSNHYPHFCVYKFPYSGLSYEWTHIVCGFCDWLCSLSVIFSGFKFYLYFYHILVVLICHFLLLNNIPWYECTTFSLSIISRTLFFSVLWLL